MKIKIPLLLRIVIAIILGMLLGMCVPDVCVRVMATFNALFDQILKFLIPLIIVGLVTPAIAELGKGAGKMLGITVVFAYSFTVLSGLFSYATSVAVFPSLIDSQHFAEIATATEDPFPPFFVIAIPPMMEVMTANTKEQIVPFLTTFQSMAITSSLLPSPMMRLVKVLAVAAKAKHGMMRII